MLLPLKSSDRRPSYSVHVLQRVARHRYLLPFTMALSIASFLLIATMSTTDDRQVGTELVFRDPMSPRPPPKPLPIQELNALRGQPVAHPYRPMTAQELGLLTVYIDSGHYLGPGYAHVIDRCPWRDGEFLQCEFSNTPSRRQESHALWVHVPGAPGGIQRTHPNQKLVVMSIERYRRARRCAVADRFSLSSMQRGELRRVGQPELHGPVRLRDVVQVVGDDPLPVLGGVDGGHHTSAHTAVEEGRRGCVPERQLRTGVWQAADHGRADPPAGRLSCTRVWSVQSQPGVPA